MNQVGCQRNIFTPGELLMFITRLVSYSPYFFLFLYSCILSSLWRSPTLHISSHHMCQSFTTVSHWLSTWALFEAYLQVSLNLRFGRPTKKEEALLTKNRKKKKAYSQPDLLRVGTTSTGWGIGRPDHILF